MLALAAAILSSASVGEVPAARADFQADVEALIFRNAGCNLAATRPGNEAAQREAERLHYKCDAIATDFATLYQKYQIDPRVLKALDFEILPADVEALIFRHGGCNSEATDTEIATTARRDAARLYLKCDSLAQDEDALRRKYTYDARVLKALDGKGLIVIRQSANLDLSVQRTGGFIEVAALYNR